MQNRFIWNIDQDVIHFVNDFNFEEPLEDNYITGDYLPTDQSISLYKENINVPINLDHFVRLWKASEPDKEILRERVSIVETNKTSNVKVSASQEEVLVAKFLAGQQMLGEDTILNLDRLFQANPSPDDIRRYFIPFIRKYNTSAFEQFPDNLPRNSKQWRALSEEEVFAYVEQFANSISKGDKQIANSLIQAMMDKWETDGVPFDPAEYIIDEGMINWNEVSSLLRREFGNSFNVFSKWKKVSDYNGWTNWETWNVNLMMENDYEDHLYFMELAKKNISVDDFAMAVIERVIGPYNEQLRNDFAEYTDEEEILMKLENDDQTWRSDAERRYPDDPEAQEEYVRKMREMIYGIMGIPEPTDIADHWLDESKVNWQEIYEHWINNTKESSWKVLKWKKI
jgi:hypothetical protein